MESILFPTDLSKNTGKTMKDAIQYTWKKKCKLILFQTSYNLYSKKGNPGNQESILITMFQNRIFLSDSKTVKLMVKQKAPYLS